ncbi:hypothetical protein ACFYSH_25570 [Streptomyces sp. NPDC005791]|uniref:hypothetical protein n=1 Tax=Streptomyces sp. NPDC005791 TaxID=3364732 RepID=UPI0036A916B3
MPVPLMGLLLLLCVATAGAGIVVAVVALNSPSRTVSGFFALLPLIFAPAAGAVYCYGWFSVHLGGPFPELCAERTTAGAELRSLEQEEWPLRSACVYSDGSTVEHVSMSVNVLVCVLAGLAVVMVAARAFRYRRTRQPARGAVVRLP